MDALREAVLLRLGRDKTRKKPQRNNVAGSVTSQLRGGSRSQRKPQGGVPDRSRKGSSPPSSNPPVDPSGRLGLKSSGPSSLPDPGQMFRLSSAGVPMLSDPAVTSEPAMPSPLKPWGSPSETPDKRRQGGGDKVPAAHPKHTPPKLTLQAPAGLGTSFKPLGLPVKHLHQRASTADAPPTTGARSRLMRRAMAASQRRRPVTAAASSRNWDGGLSGTLSEDALSHATLSDLISGLAKETLVKSLRLRKASVARASGFAGERQADAVTSVASTRIADGQRLAPRPGAFTHPSNGPADPPLSPRSPATMMEDGQDEISCHGSGIQPMPPKPVSLGRPGPPRPAASVASGHRYQHRAIEVVRQHLNQAVGLVADLKVSATCQDLVRDSEQARRDWEPGGSHCRVIG